VSETAINNSAKHQYLDQLIKNKRYKLNDKGQTQERVQFV